MDFADVLPILIVSIGLLLTFCLISKSSGGGDGELDGGEKGNKQVNWGCHKHSECARGLFCDHSEAAARTTFPQCEGKAGYKAPTKDGEKCEWLSDDKNNADACDATSNPGKSTYCCRARYDWLGFVDWEYARGTCMDVWKEDDGVLNEDGTCQVAHYGDFCDSWEDCVDSTATCGTWSDGKNRCCDHTDDGYCRNLKDGSQPCWYDTECEGYCWQGANPRSCKPKRPNGKGNCVRDAQCKSGYCHCGWGNIDCDFAFGDCE